MARLLATPGCAIAALPTVLAVSGAGVAPCRMLDTRMAGAVVSTTHTAVGRYTITFDRDVTAYGAATSSITVASSNDASADVVAGAPTRSSWGSRTSRAPRSTPASALL